MEKPRGYRARSGDGVLFSSSHCPPGPGMENCLELPMGFVWTPMAPLTEESNAAVVHCDSEALPPVICTSCLTYINMHAKLLEGNRWDCPLCGSDENVLDESLLRQGGLLSSALSTPIVEYRQKFRHCDLLEAPISSCTYILVLDANLSRVEANAVGEAVEAACATNKGEDDCEVKLGLIVFDNHIAMYQLGLSGMAAADLCTIKQANSDEHLANRKSQILKRPYLATIRPGSNDMSSLWRCISAVFGTTVSGDGASVNESPEEAPRPLSRLELLKQRKDLRLRQQAQREGHVSREPRESPWVKARAKKAAMHPSRCTGEALQCAIDLATICQSKTNGRSQILLFTNGCPNLGDGSVVLPGLNNSIKRKVPHRIKPDVIEPERLTSAVRYFEKLAEVAQEHEVGIDVFCTGKFSQ